MGPDTAFDILPAQVSDIPRLAQIHVISCMPDNCFRSYFDGPEEFDKRVREMLRSQIGEDSWCHVKVVDRVSGIIAAWASWKTPSDAEIHERDKSEKVEVAKTKGDFDFPPGLAAHVKVETDAWIQSWTRNRRHIMLKALFTDPAFQRRGMGNAMVQYGNQIADREGLPTILYASAYGWPIYAKRGFQLVSHLDIDLSHWIAGAEQNDRGFGNYRFRYMIRLPETVGKMLRVSQ